MPMSTRPDQGGFAIPRLRPRFADPRPGYRTHREPTTVGVATTGQISPKGTVTHWDHWMGELDATVRPQPVRVPPSLMKFKWSEEHNAWLPLRMK